MDKLEKQFLDYSQKFLVGDDEYNQSIQLKIDHSMRVRNEALGIAQSEGWDKSRTRTVVSGALLHDYGRFEQFKKYNTFNDNESINHGHLSAELVAKHNMLADFSEKEQSDILSAIRIHNALAIPESLTGEALIIAQAIRDADKLDIMPIVIKHLEDPDKLPSITWEMTDVQETITPEVLEYVLNEKSPPHAILKTLQDVALARISWAFELNYAYSRQAFAKRGFVQKLKASLPNSPEVDKICELALRKLENCAN